APGVVDRDRLVAGNEALYHGGGHRPVRDPQHGPTQGRQAVPGGHAVLAGHQDTAWSRAAGAGLPEAGSGTVPGSCRAPSSTTSSPLGPTRSRTRPATPLRLRPWTVSSPALTLPQPRP